MKSNQKGFTIIEGLLIGILITLIVGVGYYVYHSQKQVDKTYSQTANSTAVPSSNNSSTSSNKKYLVIKEWNVKLPITNEDIGAYYTYDSAASLNVKYYDAVTLHDKDVDQLTNSEGTSCKDSRLYFIARAKTSDVAKLEDPNSPDFVGDTSPSDYKSVSFTKDYEFAGETAHGGIDCSFLNNGGSDSSVAQKYDQAVKALESSYGYMQAD